MLKDFTAIDFETAYYAPESACAIGLVRFRDGKEVGTHYTLIRPPELYVRPDFIDIHGLTADMLRDQQTFDRLWPAIEEFIGDDVLVAHNASFDKRVLSSTCLHYNIMIPGNRFVCSLQASRKAWPELRSFKLTSLGSHFNIVYDAHNALDDARTCGKILCMAQEKKC